MSDRKGFAPDGADPPPSGAAGSSSASASAGGTGDLASGLALRLPSDPPAAPGDAYRRLARRRLTLIGLAAFLVASSLVADVLTGPAMLSVPRVARAVVSPDAVSATDRTIVWTLRLPPALLALVVGCALGIAGAEMQTILNNPLASPYTVGVASGASFGAALALVGGAAAVPVAEATVVPLCAFAFAMLCSLAVYGAARLRGASTESIVLAGVALLFLFNAGIACMQYVASEEQLAAIVFWTFGSLQKATWPKLAVVASVLAIAAPLLAAHAWKLTSLRMGDDRARSLGIDVERLRLGTLVVVSILTATAVCFVGTIGFIGLVAPHLARSLVGEDQRFFVPLAALGGALLLSVASIASKLVAPGAVFPIGIATALFGVPFFAAMILSRRRTYW